MNCQRFCSSLVTGALVCFEGFWVLGRMPLRALASNLLLACLEGMATGVDTQALWLCV
jgi:hypothetical protein